MIQLGDLFLKSNDGKTMIYSYSYKSSEKEKNGRILESIAKQFRFDEFSN